MHPWPHLLRSGSTMKTFLAYQKGDSPLMMVEVHPEVDRASQCGVDLLLARMRDRALYCGILFAQEHTHFVRLFQPDRVVALKTAVVLSRIEQTGLLCVDVRHWLNGVSKSWMNSVPDEALGVMLPELVGALGGAEFIEFDGAIGA